MTEVTLPSGAILQITLSSFPVSKELYQTILEEFKHLNLDGEKEIDPNLFKDIFCTGFSSKKIEKCVWKCMEKAVYNKLKIDENTFEPEEARQDYTTVLMEVAKANVNPFLKSLYAQYSKVLEILQKPRASERPTTN